MGGGTRDHSLDMKQHTALRRVTRQYNDFQLSASLITIEASGNHQWTAVMTMSDGSHRENFGFFEKDQQLVFPNPVKVQEVPMPEFNDFARFCVDVNRARI